MRWLTDAGVNAEIELRYAEEGGPANVLAEVAARDGADVIVIGTRGHSTIAGILTGSVAHRLVHAAHCPLMMIPPPARTSAGADLSPERRRRPRLTASGRSGAAPRKK